MKTPRKEPIPEPIQEEAPKEEEKPEEIIEPPVEEKPQPAPKAQKGKTVKGKTTFWPRGIQKRPCKTNKGRTTKCNVRQRHLQQSQRGKEQSDEREIEIFSIKIFVKYYI